MATIDAFVYLSKYVVDFFFVDTTKIGERVSSSVEGIVNKDKVSSVDLYLSCFVPVFWELTFLQVMNDGSHPFILFLCLHDFITCSPSVLGYPLVSMYNSGDMSCSSDKARRAKKSASIFFARGIC